MSFEELDLYAELQLGKKSKQDEIRKAYLKLSLSCHPDRLVNASEEEREEAKMRFQKLGFAYSILSDEKKRKHYDRTGSIQEDSVDWAEYVQTLFRKVTEEDIQAFEKAYKGSEEERRDLVNLYNKHKGDLIAVMDDLLLGDIYDEERYRSILEDAIKNGEIKRMPKFEKSKLEKKLELRKKRAEKEAKEAEELAKELGLYSSNGGLSVIRDRSKRRMDELADQLMEKYATKPKGKSRKRNQFEVEEK